MSLRSVAILGILAGASKCSRVALTTGSVAPRVIGLGTRVILSPMPPVYFSGVFDQRRPAMFTAVGFEGDDWASVTLPNFDLRQPDLSDHDLAEIAYLNAMFAAPSTGGNDE